MREGCSYSDNFQVNNHSFSTFANTISFNISRYPTPVEITDSKNYRAPDKADQAVEKAAGVENGEGRAEEEEEVGVSEANSNIEYVPAEYFRGVDTHQFAQSGEAPPTQFSPLTFTFTVSVSKAVTFVKPEVLASGRILTHMTPLPSSSTLTSTTTESIPSAQVVNSDDRLKPREAENGDHNPEDDPHQNK